jgi:alpha-1,2-mannosyltransferase
MTARPRSRALAGWLLVTVAAGVSWFCFAHAVRQSDLHVFLTAADKVLAGANPYTANDDPYLWSGSAFVYPWLAAFLFAPFTLLPTPTACLVFSGLSSAALVAGCRTLGLRSAVAISALLLAAPVLRNAEVGALNAVLFLLGAVLWRWRDSTPAVVACVVLLLGTKLFLAPLLLWVVLTRGWRCTGFTLGALATYFGTSFLFGPVTLTTYLRSLSLLSQHEALAGMSMRHLSALRGWPAWAPTAIGAVLLAVIVVVWSRGRNDALLYAGCLSAGLLLTPILWNSYLVVALLIVLVVRPSAPWVVAAAGGSWCLVGTARLHAVAGFSAEHRMELLLTALLVLPLLALRRRLTLNDELDERVLHTPTGQPAVLRH